MYNDICKCKESNIKWNIDFFFVIGLIVICYKLVFKRNFFKLKLVYK